MDGKVSAKIEKFFSSYPLQEFKKGDILIRAYDSPKGIFYLIDGTVKMYSISKNGDEFVLTIFKPVSFFPMSHAVNEGENLYFYETVKSVKARIAPMAKVTEFVKTNPDVLFDLLQRVYKGMDGMLLKMVYATTEDANSRLIAELLTKAKRFGKEKDGVYELDISERDLATEVGLARETVSREIKELKIKNLITIKNKKLIITDMNRLEKEIT
jgi:CRP-like cAMP-binding protein